MPDFVMVDVDTALIGRDRAVARLDSLDLALHDMRGPLRGVISDLHRQSDAQFASLGSAAGTPWDPLDPSTVSGKMRMGYPFPGWPLVATGALMASAHGTGPYDYGSTADMSATFGLNMPRDGWNIAALQQFGVPWERVHRRAYTTRLGHHIRATSYMWHLPSRPMIVSTQGIADAGMNRIVAHIWSPFL